MSDVLLHIDENTNKDERELLRDTLFNLDGVISADCQDATPHLIIVGYDSDLIKASDFLSAIKNKGMHAELIGL